MDHGAGISSSKANPRSSTSSSSSTSSPGSLLERRNRRRSSALAGTNPADTPLTDSDQKLAATITRINLQNAASRPPKQSVPAFIVPPLDLTISTTAPDHNQPTEKTPTQISYRVLSSQRTNRAVIRSQARNGSLATTTFHLFQSTRDKSGSNTPTQREQNTSPITAKQQISPARSSPCNENSGYELPPFRPYIPFQLSPRLFTQRKYTSSPFQSLSPKVKNANAQQTSPLKEVTSADTANSDTQDVPRPPSPCEPFPPFEPCPPLEDA